MTARLPYFIEPERIAALKADIAALRAKGVTWRHMGAQARGGMECGLAEDCLFWVKSFKRIGALPDHIEIPPYRQMEAAGDKMALLRLRIMETHRAELIYEGPFAKRFPLWLVGDVMLFKTGMSGVHCGLVVQRHPLHFFHLSQNGALEEPFQQGKWIADLQYGYRLMAEVVAAPVPGRPSEFAAGTAATTPAVHP